MQRPKIEQKQVIYIWVYRLTAKIVHFHFELVKAILSYCCELTRFKSVLHELPVYSVKSREMT